MKFDLKFPSVGIEEKFQRVLLDLPISLRDRIMEAVEKLAENPYPYGEKNFLKLETPVGIYNYIAQYRLRIGDYRVLYDVDKKRKIVWVLALRKRNEQTYR